MLRALVPAEVQQRRGPPPSGRSTSTRSSFCKLPCPPEEEQIGLRDDDEAAGDFFVRDQRLQERQRLHRLAEAHRVAEEAATAASTMGAVEGAVKPTIVSAVLFCTPALRRLKSWEQRAWPQLAR